LQHPAAATWKGDAEGEKSTELNRREVCAMIALLMRHAHTTPVGHSVAGRQPGIGLSADGRRDVARLVHALTWAPLSAVYTSPLERAVQTALPLAAAHGLDVQARPGLTDIDFGAWTGKALEQLSADPEWERFNRDREHACPPGGEPLADVQRRVVAELMTLARPHAGEMIALVSHAEPIRCVLAACAGQSLNEAMTIDIHPGHMCSIGIISSLRSVLAVNVDPDEITV
jgi:broad specificity phosphatase PhoE